MVKSAAALLLGGLAVGVMVACVTGSGVERRLLPDSPLALLHRPEAEALRRLDALADLEKSRTGAGRAEGVANLGGLRALLGAQEDLDPRLINGRGHLTLLDPRTGEIERLASAPPQARPAAWSPDRRRLLMSGTWRDRRQLFAWDREADQMEILTGGRKHHVNGCLAYGDRLVVVEVASASLENAAQSQLMASGPGGGALEAINKPGLHFAMSCSPTRAQVAYVRLSAETGRPQLLVQNLDPLAEPHEVATGAAPVYTPDGEWIVYVGITVDGGRLFRVRPDGSGRTRLGAGVLEEGSPAVSPDGAYVAFVVTDLDGRERLWVRRIDGTGDRPLLTDGDGAVPVW